MNDYNALSDRELNNEMARRRGYRVEWDGGSRYALVAPDKSVITVSESEAWAWDNVSFRPADDANDALALVDGLWVEMGQQQFGEHLRFALIAGRLGERFEGYDALSMTRCLSIAWLKRDDAMNNAALQTHADSEGGGE